MRPKPTELEFCASVHLITRPDRFCAWQFLPRTVRGGISAGITLEPIRVTFGPSPLTVTSPERAPLPGDGRRARPHSGGVRAHHLPGRRATGRSRGSNPRRRRCRLCSPARPLPAAVDAGVDETEAVLLGLRYVDQCGDEILMQAATSALAKISSVLSPGVQSVLTAPTTLAFRGYVSRRAVQRHSRSHPVRQWTGVTKRLGTRCALLRHDKARAGSDLFPNGYLGCMTCRSFRSLQLRVSVVSCFFLLRIIQFCNWSK